MQTLFVTTAEVPPTNFDLMI